MVHLQLMLLRNSGVNTGMYLTYSIQAASSSSVTANECTVDDILANMSW